MKPPQTSLCSHTEQAIFYGRDNLVDDLIGKASFLDVFFRQAFRRIPTDAERRMSDAILIALMEHGMTPSVIAARMVYSSSPENLQAGVAAGLLAVASRFIGTMEEAAALLGRIVHAADPGMEARRIATDFKARREPVPGFGHHLHKPDAPRAIALMDMARQLGLAGPFASSLGLLAGEVDAASGRHLTVNATGAVAAILGDMGIPVPLMRGFAVLARTAGLIAHIAEEQRDPSGRFIWDLVDRSMNADPEATNA